MLVPIALDATGLAAAADDAQYRAWHRRLVEILLEHGWLVFADRLDHAALLDAIQGLPASVQPIWLEAMMRLPMRAVSDRPARSVSSLDTLVDIVGDWASCARLVLCDDEKCTTLLAIDPSDASVVDAITGLEVGRLELVSEMEVLRNVLALASTEIRAGQSREDVWRERVKPLIAASDQITIVDRYAGARYLRAGERGLISGLEWFLSRSSSTRRLGVHLVTEVGSRSAGRLASELGGLAPVLSGSLSSFEVTMATSAAFSPHGHARHVEFGGRYVFTLDKGLEIFEEPTVVQGTPFVYGDLQAARAREDAITMRALPSFRRRRLW
jgi:hypothetical protein